MLSASEFKLGEAVCSGVYEDLCPLEFGQPSAGSINDPAPDNPLLKSELRCIELQSFGTVEPYLAVPCGGPGQEGWLWLQQSEPRRAELRYFQGL